MAGVNTVQAHCIYSIFHKDYSRDSWHKSIRVEVEEDMDIDKACLDRWMEILKKEEKSVLNIDHIEIEKVYYEQ